jgi:hypothetical protein
MKLTEVSGDTVQQFKGEARTVEELIASIENGRFTLDGRKLIVRGDLSLGWTGLTSLLGCPQYVQGNFNCSFNRLETLEGAPQKVNGDFYCSDNTLKTLVGAPQEVGGNFNCARNQLKTLKGGPRRVGTSFSCINNELETLEGGPIEVGGSYVCDDNELTSLHGMPLNIKDSLWCNNNQLTSLKGCAHTIKNNLHCMNNKLLTSLEGAPSFVGKNVYFNDCIKLISLRNIHLYFSEVRGTFNFINAGVKEHMLGLLLVRGLQGVILNDFKLGTILHRYLNGGNILACAMELIEGGYEEQAKL